MGETKRPPKVSEAKNEDNEAQNNTALEPQYEVWKPDRLNPNLSELNRDDRKTLLLYRTVNSILNKLTPENFSKLEKNVKQLSIDTPTRMQGVIDIIHKKAVCEWKFRPLYAEFCNLMRDIQVVNEEGILLPFTQFLINKCETYFDKSFIEDLEFDRRKREINLCNDPEMKKFLKKEYELEECLFRKQSVGNCQFMGELFKLDMIYPNKIFQMLDRLFETGGNMAIECICAILSTIGQFYEEKFDKFPAEYIEHLDSLVLQENLTSRIRFLIQNVLDLRNNSWRPRIKLELPKTLQQIEQDLLDEENLSEQFASKIRVKNKNKSRKNRKKVSKG